MNAESLREYAPKIYSGFAEYEALMSAEDILLTQASQAVKDLHDDQFVLSATEEGIEQYETMLNIIPNVATEDLEFRRNRILNRLAFASAFTLSTLRKKLDAILGQGTYDIYVDYASYTMYLESSATDQNWFNEILITMVQTKPANIVFINKPLVSSRLNLSEEVSYDKVNYNYRAGYWLLGHLPFNSIQFGGTLKMKQRASIQPSLLQAVATFTAADITGVLINSVHKVSDFITKQATNDECVVEYRISEDITSEITTIALLDADEQILSEFPVYVPVSGEVILKHIIKVKEG